MLDTETKRRIDTARDILVGKVPDPKSQVEQITIALIYKFMDDMDQESIDMGGQRSFFTGEYEKYAWRNIFDPRLGGYEMLALYADAITRMSLNPSLPQLFRDIFRNAFLPYRDPETLKMFLKTINEFTYDHSERLGDAFEYLLSVLGSQGDAGQFRTPRHIIDFMVQVVKPQKNETILDPACGTAGFLIAAYKYILAHNLPSPARRGAGGEVGGSGGKVGGSGGEVGGAGGEVGGAGGEGLSPDDRKRLLTNFKGYDISPDMVRLSRVNLYLHGFVQPQIYEYDTLASEERWLDYADVILANPPFMSPKGGIKPHKRFSVQSNRSEVLFVDYMADHLTPTGRAAIIVPEGIIFQSANAYKQLRKYLVEKELLWAVVSLPGGLFNPYAGVKTSILFLDKTLANKTDQILFIKVEDDGYDLGAQRRPIDRNDLPDALNVLNEWSSVIATGTVIASRAASVIASEAKQSPATDPEIASSQTALLAMTPNALLVAKSRLAEGEDYNLSADRYRETLQTKRHKFPMVTLGDVCLINPETAIPAEMFGDSNFVYIDISSVENGSGKIDFGNTMAASEAPSRARRLIQENDVLLSTVRPNLKAFAIATNLPSRVIASTGFAVLRASARVLPQYLLMLVRDDNTVSQMIQMMGRGAYPSINQSDVASIKIPLPSLEVQREIVAEIEGYQRLIEGARQVVENWKPDLELELEEERKTAGVEDWETVKLGDVATLEYGFTASAEETGDARFIRITDITDDGTLNPETAKYVTITAENENYLLLEGDLLVARTGATYGKTLHFEGNEKALFASYLIRVRFANGDILPKYYWYFSRSDEYWKQAKSLVTGGGQPQFNGNVLKQVEFTRAPLEVQRAIVARIETERDIVEANRRLASMYEAKIKKVIERVWEG